MKASNSFSLFNSTSVTLAPAGDKLQGMAMQVQIDDIKFHSDSFKDKYDIVQKSVFRNDKWIHIIEDKSIKVDKILDNAKICN